MEQKLKSWKGQLNMEEYQKILNFYMEKLDGWVENNYNNMDGVFSYLSDNLLVRKLAVSPNVKSGLEGLQSFLATEILGIHRNKASKISYQIIQRYLAGEDLKKKYRFKFDLLPRTLDMEANKEALLKDSDLLKELREKKGPDYLQSGIEQCKEWLPFILIDEARKVLWTKANNYYSICTESFCDGCNKKKQVYYQFVQAAILFEILYLEFVQEPFHEHIKKAKELMHPVEEDVTVFYSEIKNILIEKSNAQGGEELNQYVVNHGLDVLDKVQELANEINIINLFSFLEAEFAKDICAMYNLLMVFETVNVHEDNRADMQRAIQMEAEFNVKYGKCFEAFERTNEDKRVCYRRVNEHLEMVLSQYADKDYNITGTVVGFLEQLRKKIEKKDAPHYDGFLCLLALPVYKSLGGGKKIHIDKESDVNRK